jgi:uncharacterized lipoprotein YajG
MQKERKLVWWPALAILLLAGCASSPQVVRLDLQPKVAATSKGRNVAVAVRVQDKRPENVIGYQSHTNGQKQNPIVALEDIKKTIYKPLVRGLRKEGFEPLVYTDSSAAKPRLTVILDTLSYRRSGGQIHVEAQLTAHAETARQNFSSTYTVNKKKSHDLLASQSENAELINGALSDALGNLLNDNQLLSVLAGQ